MILSAKEKDCLQFLVNWDQKQGITFERKVIMEALDVDQNVYEALILKNGRYWSGVLCCQGIWAGLCRIF